MKKSVPFALLSLLIGCIPDLSVEGGLDISCAFNEDCPDAQLCHPSLERCVNEGAIDTTPAGFVALPVVEPPVGGANVSFAVAFEVNEELVADPLVFLDRGDRIAALSAIESDTDRAARRYRFGYESDGDETEGARPVVVTLIDLQGNTSTVADAAAIVLDFAPPTLASPPLLSAEGGEVTLQFVMSEPLPAPPVVEMTGPGGTIAWGAVPTSDEFPFFFAYAFTPDVSLAAGTYAVRIRATDAAGNEMDVNAGDVTVD